MTAAAVIAVVAGGAGGAGAEPLMLTLDAPRSTIRWVLRGFPDTVHGTFRLERGALGFDTDSGVADGCLRVDARSGESGNATRDRKMHEQILESSRYPDVTLRPTRIEGSLPADGDGSLRMQGVLSLHGAEHPVIVPLRVTRRGSTVTADATLTVPYVAWGLADPSVFVFRAAKTVDLELHAVGVVTPAALRPIACGP